MAQDSQRSTSPADTLAPRPPRSGWPARLSNSVLAKIILPLVVALAIGALVTAAIAGRVSGGAPTLSGLELLAVAALLLPAAVMLTWVTIRAVTRPLAILSRTARQVAAGNLAVKFSHASNDEIGQLASSLETMRREVSSQLELISAQADALRESSKRITSARDEERRRLARDMHDGLQQQLVMLRIGLGMAAERVRREPDQAAQIFAELGRDLERVLERVREVSHDLYPSILRDRGLTSAVRSQASTLPLSVKLASTPDPLPRLAREVESSAYFLLSEAIANVLKHSGASEVSLGLELEGACLVITVADNGHGMLGNPPGGPGQHGLDFASGGGLTNMDDRVRALGGDLTVTSGPQGTAIRATFPLIAASLDGDPA